MATAMRASADKPPRNDFRIFLPPVSSGRASPFDDLVARLKSNMEFHESASGLLKCCVLSVGLLVLVLEFWPFVWFRADKSAIKKRARESQQPCPSQHPPRAMPRFSSSAAASSAARSPIT